MPFQTSDFLARVASFLVVVFVLAGLVANLAFTGSGTGSGTGSENGPALAVPTALAYLALAFLAHPGWRPSLPWRPLLALIIALGCAAFLADRWAGILGGQLDPLLRRTELRSLGFGGHVSTKSLVFIGVCALAVLSSSQHRFLSTPFVLGLLAMTNVAVVDLAMAGALWDSELSVWSTLCGFTLTFSAALQQGDRSVFGPLLLAGPAGRALRSMAIASMILPMAAGWYYARTQVPTAEEMQLIALLFGGLGWSMFQITFLLGIVIARDLRHIEALSRQDPLTSLLNRAGFEAAMADLRTDVAGVMLGDVDQFKTVNDRFGHLRGDALLREIADAIRATLGEENHSQDAIVTRLGGDEFLIVVPNLTEPHLRAMADRLARAVGSLPPVTSETHQYRPSMSLGCVTFVPGQMSLEDALRAADDALYWGKRTRLQSLNEQAPAMPEQDAGATMGNITPPPLDMDAEIDLASEDRTRAPGETTEVTVADRVAATSPLGRMA